MRKKEKGKSGAVTNYVTRNQALKRLRLSLADFRRLCIVKGIYPREPSNLKKVGKGNTAPKTYYWTKDIQYLAHEPLLKRFRDFKAFTKKLRRALGRKEHSVVRSLKKNRPVYTLDHLIRERYPTFVDAVRDLDDALCMLALFAKMSSTKHVFGSTIARCERLVAEFQQYCIQTSAVRKVFLSIKGVYYQAEVAGQLVTWIAPYHLSQKVPTDVDFRVMFSFLEFYETLVGFVNFKLYHDEGLRYPPFIDRKKDDGGGGLASYVLKPAGEPTMPQPMIEAAASASAPTDDDKTRKESAHRIATLQAKLAAITEHDDDKGNVEPKPAATASDNLDEFPENKAIAESSNEVALADLREKDKQLRVFKRLFSGLVFFVSRECPQDSLIFLIRCFGGQVGWEAGAGSPFAASDEGITHHIFDRDGVKHVLLGREYVQPQWVYDSINFQRLMPTQGYGRGEALPPHFSPFVAEQEGDYVPRELRVMRGEPVEAIEAAAEAPKPAKKQEPAKQTGKKQPQPQPQQGAKRKAPEPASDEGSEGEEEEDDDDDAELDDDEEEIDEDTLLERELDEEDADEDEDAGSEDGEDDEEDSEMEAVDSDDEEAVYQRELQAEAAGIPYSEFESKMRKVGKTKVKASELRKKAEAKEQHDLAKSMMRKKDKRLYNKITAAQNRKKHYVDRMEKKRKAIDEAKAPAAPAAPATNGQAKRQRVK